MGSFLKERLALFKHKIQSQFHSFKGDFSDYSHSVLSESGVDEATSTRNRKFSNKFTKQGPSKFEESFSCSSQSLESEEENKQNETARIIKQLKQRFVVEEQLEEVSEIKEESNSLQSSDTFSDGNVDKNEKQEVRKLCMLVANDNDFQRLIITNNMRNLNVIGRVDEASNGQEALELVKQSMLPSSDFKYDMILLDLEMPIMDGYTACKKINSHLEFLIEEMNLHQIK